MKTSLLHVILGFSCVLLFILSYSFLLFLFEHKYLYFLLLAFYFQNRLITTFNISGELWIILIFQHYETDFNFFSVYHNRQT